MRAIIALCVAFAGFPLPLWAQSASDSTEAVEQPRPTYQTVFDRDRSRNNWTQTLTYSRDNGRTAFSGNGNMTTQDFIQFPNRVTFGTFDGRLDTRLARRWNLSLGGRFDMYSSNDGSARTDARDNRLQVRTQYSINPIPSVLLTGSAYTEFLKRHSRTIQSRISESNADIDPVDTLLSQRDSSYTTGRQDGVSGSANWRAATWLQLDASATASRLRPHQRSLVRDFATPLDASSGTVNETRESTREPTNNANYSSRLSFTRLPRTTMLATFQKTEVNQSNFDRQLRGQERLSFNTSNGTIHLDHGPVFRTSMTVDLGYTRTNRNYLLRRTASSLATTRQFSAGLARSDTSSRISLGFSVNRSRYDRQISQNGIVLDRSLSGNGMKRISRRLTLEGIGSISLKRSQYADPSGDQDAQTALSRIGGGYLVSPRCSTSVHFSTTRSHLISLDPSASSSNAVQTNYQMHATLTVNMGSGFAIRQDYLLSADYRIFDYTESNNYLNRTRRIDTEMVDTLFHFATLRLTHNFIFRDQGAYRRGPGDPERIYRISGEAYEQTLAANIVIPLASGIRFVALQSLLNQRNQTFVTRSRTNYNRFALTAGIEVDRTFGDGLQIQGAVRHIGGYSERTIQNPIPYEEDYWIAGVTVNKAF